MTIVKPTFADLKSMKINFPVFSILACFLLVSTVSAEQYKLLPADESDRDLEFVEFKQQMLEAARNREPEVFVTLLSPRIFNGLNQKRGMKQFLKIWEPDSIDSELWETIEVILEMGGGFIRSEKGVEFCAPYVFSHFPSELDIYAHGVVTTENIPLKSEPSLSSDTKKMLSYDILQVLDWVSIQDKSGGAVNWLKITTMQGDSGYINREHIRSPSDYSACFLKKKNKDWKLNALLTSE